MNKKKFLKNSGWFLAVCLFLTACDAGFDAINIDETRVTSVDPALQLNNAIVSSGFGFGQLLCETTVVRQGVSPFPGVLTCANLNQDNRNQTQAHWTSRYPNQIRELTDAINNSDPGSNIHNMARIWRLYNFMLLTDTYGDVPYSEAAQAFPGEIVFPRFDPQQEIYTGNNGILAELSDATAALNPGASAPTDALYFGNVAQWQRFGNSLLLRAAMRLTKVEPATAEAYVGIAVSGPGGLMQSNEDNAKIRHTNDYTNGVGNSLTGGESPNYYMDEFFVNYLFDNNDPRLGAIAVRYPGATGGGDQWTSIEQGTEEFAPGNQIGMPQGYDNTTIVPVAQNAGLSSFFAYTQFDRTTITASLVPTFIATYSQQQLLLAEAVVHGWAQGDAATLYAQGIEAHMQQLADYGQRATIPQGDIDDYVQANPLSQTQGEQIEDINIQYWVSSLMNGPEAWANFRRSGYPDLPPNPFPASDLTNEDFFRRLTYPLAEFSVNRSNFEEAVARQGPDILDTRVWWDVAQ